MMTQILPSTYYSRKHSDTFWVIMLNNEENKQCQINIYQICTHRTILWSRSCWRDLSATYYQLIDDYSFSYHVFMTFFLWNPVCYDHKVKVMKGEFLNRSNI